MAGAIEGAGGCRRSRRSAFAVWPEQTGQSRRRDADRDGKLRAEEAKGEIPYRCSVEWSRQKGNLVESLLVSAQRSLVLGAAVGEVEHRSRQHSPRGVADGGHAVQVLQRRQRNRRRGNDRAAHDPSACVRGCCGATHGFLPPMRP